MKNTDYGIINVYKEPGYTSHDVVAIVRKVLGGCKVGHTGTLDPEAEGVLPVCIGKATKFADYVQASQKSYRAHVHLGVTTDTQDMTGRILEKRPVNVSPQAIQDALAAFTGDIQQIPPMYAAIKVNGQKLYELARKGVEVERKPRSVTIYRLSVLEFLPEEDCFVMDVTCSKGTYIRALCDDIGKHLGCGAAMGRLVRTASGRFTLENSFKLEALKNAIAANGLADILLPVEQALPAYEQLTVPEQWDKRLANGNPLPLPALLQTLTTALTLQTGDKLWVYNSLGQLAGLFEVQPATLHPLVVLL